MFAYYYIRRVIWLMLTYEGGSVSWGEGVVELSMNVALRQLVYVHTVTLTAYMYVCMCVRVNYMHIYMFPVTWLVAYQEL